MHNLMRDATFTPCGSAADAALSPRERLMMFECGQGNCPRCDQLRGLDQPEDCDHPRCPRARDIERWLLPRETLR